MRAPIAVLCVIAALSVLSAAPSGQTPATPPKSPQQPTFRSAIDAVSVDVVVTDKQGKPVTDLTAADFEVKENNKVQTIDSFKRIIVAEDKFDQDPAKSAPITSMEAMEREAAREDVRLITVFLDDYHTRKGNAMAVRDKVARFIQELDPHDLVAIVYPLTPTSGLTFSRDHDGMAQAVRKFTGRKYDYQQLYPQEDIYNRLTTQQKEDLRNTVTIGALEGLCVYLGSLREGKKTILYVGEGMAGMLPSEISSDGRVQMDPTAPKTTTAADRASFFAGADLLNRMTYVFQAASRSNTSIYTLDPRGLATGEFDMSDVAIVSPQADRAVLNETQDMLRVLADQTDGRAIVNRNDPTLMLRQILTDTSAYYLLGYTSTEAPRDGKFHEIKVTLKRKGLEIRSRKGYWAMSAENVARSAEGPAKPTLPSDIADAFASVDEPVRGHPSRTWVGFDKADDGKSTVTLVWEAAPDLAASDTPQQMNVLANYVTGDQLFKGRVAKDPAALTPAGKATFTSPPGALRLRLSAEDAGGAVLDSEEKEFNVPDFSKVGPVVTTPMVFRARTARELSQLRQSATALPTSVRTFARTEQLLLRFRAYGPGGTPPKITMRLINSVGEAMTTFPPPEARPDGYYDVPLSLGGLVSGTFAIEIEAASSDLKSRTLVGFKIGG